MTERARVKQIDMERAIVAAKKKGASRVVLRPDGSLSIELTPAADLSPQSTGQDAPPRKPLVF